MGTLNISEFFAENGRIKKFRKGETIMMPGETYRDVMMIKSGAVKIYDIDAEGNERTVSIFGAGHYMPIAWLLEEEKDVLFFYNSLCQTEVYSVLHSKVIDYIKERPDVLMQLVRLLSKAYINHDARIYSLERASVQERLEFTLYYLAVRLGRVHEGRATIPFAITQHEIANLAGASRESISRELAKIASSGKISVSGGKTYIDLSKVDTKNIHKVYVL